MKDSVPIIILGMHRSGTSCLAGSLEQAGLHLGEVLQFNLYNKKGNRENPAIMALNESVLAENGGSWRAPPKGEIKWTGEQAEERDRIISQFSQEAVDYWGFKDPRTLLTFDFWRQGLPDHFKIIGTFRHPFEVVSSLANRPEPIHVPISEGLALWEYYNKIFIRLQNKYKFYTLSFNLDKADYLIKLDKILKAYHLKTNLQSVDFFETELQHQKKSALKITVPDSIATLYQDLLDNSQQ
ncbi:MAG: hypothetical protein KAG28_03210 [Cocleimonas sp.]|nr:hypothetical protein [Cocleimonas sp.]